MTAPDPRLGEIEARLSAASEGSWDCDGFADGDVVNLELYDGTRWLIAGEITRHDDADFLLNAPADVAYLLAELRARDEALGRVEALLDQADEDRRVIQDDKPFARIADAVVDVGEVRAAVAAANGGGDQ